MRRVSTVLIAAALLLFLAAPGEALTIILDDGGENFGPGDQLNFTIGLANPDALVIVDAYMVLILPTGEWIFFELDQSGSLNTSIGSSDPATWKKFISTFPIITGWDTGAIPIFSYTITGTEPTGNYQLILAFMNAGTLDIVDYKVESFFLGPYPLANVLGQWSGSWTNQTFGSTGSAVFDVVDTSPGVLTVTIDLGGNVFGGMDPPAFTTTAALDSQGGVALTGGSNDLGTVTATILIDGTFTGKVESIPSMTIASTDFSGTLSGGTLDLNYTVNFTDTTTATGIIQATRQ